MHYIDGAVLFRLKRFLPNSYEGEEYTERARVYILFDKIYAIIRLSSSVWRTAPTDRPTVKALYLHNNFTSDLPRAVRDIAFELLCRSHVSRVSNAILRARVDDPRLILIYGFQPAGGSTDWICFRGRNRVCTHNNYAIYRFVLFPAFSVYTHTQNSKFNCILYVYYVHALFFLYYAKFNLPRELYFSYSNNKFCKITPIEYIKGIGNE